MTATFLEQRLDPMVSRGCTSTVQFSRTKVYSKAGRLTQRFNWKDPKHLMDLSYRARTLAEYDILRDMFYVVLGNAYIGFRVKDWGNYQLTHANSTLALISGTSFQIQRVHSVGGGAATWLRKISKPVSGTVVITRTRAGVSSLASDASVDPTTGIVSLPSHSSGDTYGVVGEFDVPMTFTDDAWVSNIQGNANDVWQSPNPIVLEEILL